MGETLTGSDGTISNGTVSARAWLRAGTQISGATGGTYLLVEADEGENISYRVSASGAGGSAQATSDPVGPIDPEPEFVAPTLTVTDNTTNPPEFSIDTGDAVIGDTFRLIWDDNSGFTTPEDLDHVFSSDDVLDGEINWESEGFGPFDVSDTIFWKIEVYRSAALMATSNPVSATILDGIAPTITSASTIGNIEAEVLAHSLIANETVEWAIVGGADAADFELSSSTLRYASNGTKAYTGTDDSYSVTVRATDTAGNWSEQTITVTVIEAEAIPTDYIVKLEADDLSSMFQTITGTTPVAIDGDAVGTWRNKAANARHLTAPANDNTRPIYRTDGTLHWVEADGSNDVLAWAGDMGLYNSGACSVFVAVRGNPAPDRTLIAEGGSTSCWYTCERAGNPTASTQAAIIRRDGAIDMLGAAPFSGATNAFDNTDNVVGHTDNGSSITPYVDGTAGTARSYTRTGTFTPSYFTLFGLRRTSFEQYFAGRVYAVLIYPRVVNSTERAQIVTYLAAKMGRTL
ncbi:hypothetical protein [Sphingopyxis sp. 2PD]|uniref:hypothetical protein n=1 Tax=Sphingopyxis sp. 2PD TaxID=2502196 RepID=UPI001BB1AA5B|nr:hypothetical protein [Sphingopyxis sp. 2PD]